MLMPSVINLELTNRCNLRCVFCDHSSLEGKMRPGEMKTSLLVKLLNEVSGLNIYELGVVGLGEPLLDTNLGQHLDEISKFKNKFVRISLNSNGTLMDANKAGLIIGSAVNLVTFSINATSKAVYKKLMGKDLFLKVIDNIKFFIEERHRHNRMDMKISIQCISSSLNNESDLRRLFSDYLDDSVIIYNRRVFNKPAVEKGGKDLVIVYKPDFSTRHPCWSLYDRVYIDINGNVYPCTIGNDCYRESSALCIGNANNDELAGIFNNDHMCMARSRVESGSLAFPECEKCTSWDIFPNNFELTGGKWVLSNNAEVRRGELDRNDHV